MAFIVEDGTGLANANAGVAVNFCDTYHADRGNAEWAAASNTAKEQAIVRATDYFEIRWSQRVKGNKLVATQALSFPRENAYYRDGNEIPAMPVEYQKCLAEYALRALTTVLAPDPTTDATGGKVIAKTETVGPITESVTYESGVATAMLKPYPAADRLAGPLLDAPTLVRA